MPKKFIMYMTFNLKLLPYRKLRLQTVKILCRKLTLPIVFLLTDLNHRIQFFNVYVLLIISTSNKFLSRKAITSTFNAQRRLPSLFTTAITHASLFVTGIWHVTILTAVLQTISSVWPWRTFLKKIQTH